MTTEDWQAALVEVRKGRDALRTLRRLGLRSGFAFLRPRQYVLVRIRAQYVGAELDPIRSPRVVLIKDSGIVHTDLRDRSPFYLYCSGFYSGGQYEDWVAFRIHKGEKNLIAAIEFRAGTQVQGARYYALE